MDSFVWEWSYSILKIGYVQFCTFENQKSTKIFNAFLFHRYAEIRYTQGGVEHLEMAKVYYSHAIKINPNNMRSLYGLLLVSYLILLYLFIEKTFDTQKKIFLIMIFPFLTFCFLYFTPFVLQRLGRVLVIVLSVFFWSLKNES